jgi:signal transduction histidine kinase
MQETLNRELAAKNEELESILQVASHDLRSPLVNIEGFSHELGTVYDRVREGLASREVLESLDPEVREGLEKVIPEALEYIRASTRKMDRLISGLLHVSRLGRTELRIERLDMNGLVDEVVKSMEYQLQQVGATVRVGDLPGCMGDAGQIGEVFSNLVDNAIKYLDKERGGRIEIYGESRDGESVYCVEDNGVGIAPEQQEKIFEIFYRPAGDEEGSQGLGLTLVRRILERHNGRVELESEPGRGSRFRVYLPGVGSEH